MILWIALAALAALALVVLVRPLLAPAPRIEGGEDSEVYAAQLEEVDADLARGVLTEADAEAARTEIARRLLRAHKAGRAGPSMRPRDWATAVVVAVFVPAFSLGAYLALGSPDYGDQPLVARTAPVSDEEIQRLLARAEERLAANPEDAEGWAAVAPVYRRLGRFDEAAAALGRVNALAGESASTLIAQAENLVLAARGEVTAEARRLFQRAASLAPDDVTPTIFLAVAARQQGNYQDAAERWRVLLRQSRGDEAWLEIAAAEFSMMAGEGSQFSRNLSAPGTPGSQPSASVREPAAPGPTAEEMQAAASMAPEARTAMIEGMVDTLATRLEEDGGTAQEWLRLVRSYQVLGREDEARAALQTALSELPEPEQAVLTDAAEVRALLSGGQ